VPPADYDVAIVGYGPTGVTLANLLGMPGVAVVVLEREAGLLPLPRAVPFDGKVMRVFETVRLAAEVAARIRPSAGMRYVNTVGQIMIERKAAPGTGPHGRAQNYLFHQPDLENARRAGVRRFPGVEVLTSTEVSAVSQDEHCARLDAGPRAFTARYAVGCDGARSLVRQAIGSGALRPRPSPALAGRGRGAGTRCRPARADGAVLQSRARRLSSRSRGIAGAGRSC
jgi:3-(3-hydroxy-phenyl)propionate hydroxylase